MVAKKSSKLSANYFKQAKPMSPVTDKNGTPGPNAKAGKPMGNSRSGRGSSSSDVKVSKPKRGSK